MWEEKTGGSLIFQAKKKKKKSWTGPVTIGRSVPKGIPEENWLGLATNMGA